MDTNHIYKYTIKQYGVNLNAKNQYTSNKHEINNNTFTDRDILG